MAVHTSTTGGVGSGNPLVRELRPHMLGGGLVAQSCLTLGPDGL